MFRKAQSLAGSFRPARSIKLAAALLVALMLSAAAIAYARSEGGYAVPWSTVDDGGGLSAGAGYVVKGTGGQHDTSILGGGQYSVRGGFWTGIDPTCLTEFSDVPPGHTFYDFVRCLACTSIVSGYSDGTFRPNNQVTRGQLSKIVSNSAGFSDYFTVQTFEDVPVGSTFYDFIERLADLSIISGYPCGGAGEPCVPPDNRPYFRPNANMTRGQSSKIIASAASLPAPPAGQRTFEDVPIGSTFWEWIEALASTGAISGYPCGSPGEPCVPPGNRPYFRPGANVTRGQSTKIVSNTFFPGCNP